MDKIDISGLDKAEVLATLYNRTHQQGMGFLHARGASGMTVEQAREELKLNEPMGLYSDYLHGRVMKVDLSGTSFSPRLYDRDNYEGAAAEAIASLRDKAAAS